MYDSRNESSDGHISTFDFLGPKSDSCDRNVAMDPCVRESEKHNKSSKLSDHEGIQFRPSKLKSGDEPGVCSQPSWSRSPPRGPGQPKPSLNKTRNSPPSLRVQAIARGQKELMEMVKAMPETSYELSLKDLVDHQKIGNEKQEDVIQVDHQKSGNEKQEDEIQVDQEKSNFTTNKKAVVRKQGSVRRQGSIRRQGSVRKQPSLKKIEKKMSRNESIISDQSGNKGLFLKMVFPMPFGGSGNKTKVAKPKTKAKPKENPYAKECTKLGNNTSTNSNAGDKSSKSTTNHKEWWKRRYPVASDGSESSGLSSNGSSGSSGSSASNDSTRSNISNKSNRKKGGLLNGCSPFYHNKKKTIVE
ncbi:hypothetical protein POM88_037355 [Heracleum sosnowskyi]|uniref:Uncharacterized protein n=1 Tax=Heracleum sosnowskyi TaxID=360622 RepID=A0AAD8HRW9_9APIA|nr:hypothetical protein POM88_037355 [Heracleum sosnowskyi]